MAMPDKFAGESSTQHALRDPTNATLVKWQDVRPGELAIFRVRLDASPWHFEPGQYALLSLPDTAAPKDGLRREFSIASPPDDFELEFYAVHIPGGAFTERLWRLGVGGRLRVEDQARGRFTLDPATSGRHLVFVATGTGLAPYLSMLRAHRDAAPWRRVVVVHGVRSAADLGYRDELQAMAAQDSSMTYVPVISGPEAGWSGAVGHAQSILMAHDFEDRAGFPLDPVDCSVFLCGNPAMVDETEKLLQGRGFVTHTEVTPGNIHFERYW